MSLTRIFAAAGPILIAIAIMPGSLLFGEPKTDEQRNAAVAKCVTERELCKANCPPIEAGAVGQQCRAQCDVKYTLCVSAVRRGSGARPGRVTSHPSVAPITPTPPKISPERVNGVSTIKATPTASPARSTSSSRAKQSPADSEKKKKERD